MKWDSETLELLMKYTQVFYNPTVTTPSQVDHKEKQSTKHAAMVEAAKVENPISQNRVKFWVSQTTHSFSVLLRKLLVSQQPLHTPTNMKHTQNDAEKAYRKQNLPQAYSKLMPKMKIKQKSGFLPSDLFIRLCMPLRLSTFNHFLPFFFFFF